jgi:hypothetical protein
MMEIEDKRKHMGAALLAYVTGLVNSGTPAAEWDIVLRSDTTHAVQERRRITDEYAREATSD